MLYASGNGATNIVFRVKDGEIYVIQTIRDGSDEVDELLTLEPGSYELTFATSGAGQALPDGGGLPAFGSFSGSIEFPTAAVTSPGGPILGEPLTLVAVPNPVRSATTLIPASSGGSGDVDITVFDLTGRRVRRFAGVGPAGVSWDGRDGDGRPVPAGIYLVRSGNDGMARVVVLR